MISHKELDIDGKKFGPSIRFWEIAKALSNEGHKITIAERNRGKKTTIQGIEIINYKPLEILDNLEKKYDVAYIET